MQENFLFSLNRLPSRIRPELLKGGTKIFIFFLFFAVACHSGMFSQCVPVQTATLIESMRSPAAVVVGVARGSETPGVTQMSALFLPRLSFQTKARAKRERWEKILPNCQVLQ